MRPRILTVLAILSGVFGAALALAQSEANAPPPPDPAMMKIDVPATKPSLIAIRYRHDLCPVCAAYEPEMDEVVELANRHDIVLLTMDLSTPATQRQSAMMAAQLGLGEFWPDDLRALGRIVFVDPATGEVVHTEILDAILQDASIGADELLAGIMEAVAKRDAER